MTEQGGLHRAMSDCLEVEICINKGRYHLYKSSKGEFVLLHFSARGDLIMDDEKTFTSAAEAVEHFLLVSETRCGTSTTNS